MGGARGRVPRLHLWGMGGECSLPPESLRAGVCLQAAGPPVHLEPGGPSGDFSRGAGGSVHGKGTPSSPLQGRLLFYFSRAALKYLSFFLCSVILLM